MTHGSFRLCDRNAVNKVLCPFTEEEVPMPCKEIAMAFTFRKGNVHDAEPPERLGGWYADPYGTAARRWYDNISGWSERVEGAGQAPDKTGVARTDEAAEATDDSTRLVDGDGKPVPLSRPVDREYMADARRMT
jgi:hypothetical protein